MLDKNIYKKNPAVNNSGIVRSFCYQNINVARILTTVALCLFSSFSAGFM